jgi:AraC family transcriptional regulator
MGILGLSHQCAAPAGVPAGGVGASALIQPERRWQTPPERAPAAAISITRWRGIAAGECLELNSDYADTHFISCALRKTEERYWVGREQFTEGTIWPGQVFLQGPTSRRRRGLVRGAFDFLRIFLPQDLILECAEAALGRSPASPITLFEAGFTDDKIVAELAKSLIDVDQHGGPLGPTFVDGIGLALTCHLVARYHARQGASTRGAAQLATWRLRKVTDYVEERLNQPLHLADLSAAAGLSRMHFAAQFRAATGRSPHTYIMHRRVARAQQLLLNREASIANVATAVGFRTHAHFTSVFKGVTGTSPAVWRNVALR